MDVDANPLLALLTMLQVASAANVCSSAVRRQCDSCVCVCVYALTVPPHTCEPPEMVNADHTHDANNWGHASITCCAAHLISE